MALDGNRLEDSIKSATHAALQAKFPVNGGLLPAEQAGCADGLQKLAEAIAEGDATETVDEITGNAEVAVASVSGVMAGPSNSGPGTGTVS